MYYMKYSSVYLCHVQVYNLFLNLCDVNIKGIQHRNGVNEGHGFESKMIHHHVHHIFFYVSCLSRPFFFSSIYIFCTVEHPQPASRTSRATCSGKIRSASVTRTTIIGFYRWRFNLQKVSDLRWGDRGFGLEEVVFVLVRLKIATV